MQFNNENERVFRERFRGIEDKIIKALFDKSPILQRSKIYQMKGKLQLPYYDITNKRIAMKLVGDPAPSVGEFKFIVLDGYLGRARYLIPLKLIRDAQFPIVDFIVKEIVDTISSFIANEILNGTEGKIEGLSKLENKITSAASNDITADEIIDLQGKVIDENDAIWIMHPYTSQVLRRLKDNAGRYLLEPYYDITGSFSSTLLGRPVYVSDNMPKMESGKTAIYYGDISGLAVKISDIEFSIDKENYISSNAAGVFVFLKFDAKVRDPQKIAKLVMC